MSVISLQSVVQYSGQTGLQSPYFINFARSEYTRLVDQSVQVYIWPFIAPCDITVR